MIHPDGLLGRKQAGKKSVEYVGRVEFRPDEGGKGAVLDKFRLAHPLPEGFGGKGGGDGHGEKFHGKPGAKGRGVVLDPGGLDGKKELGVKAPDLLYAHMAHHHGIELGEAVEMACETGQPEFPERLENLGAGRFFPRNLGIWKELEGRLGNLDHFGKVEIVFYHLPDEIGFDGAVFLNQPVFNEAVEGGRKVACRPDGRICRQNADGPGDGEDLLWRKGRGADCQNGKKPDV